MCKEIYFRYRNNPKHILVHEKLAAQEFIKKKKSEKVTRKQKQRSFVETSFLQEPQRQRFVLMVVVKRLPNGAIIHWNTLVTMAKTLDPIIASTELLIYFKPDIYMLCFQDLFILTHYIK